MKLHRKSLLVFALLAAVVLAVVARYSTHAFSAVPPAPAELHATVGNIRDTLTGKGTVSYQHQLVLKAPRSGQVDRVWVDEGVTVGANAAIVHVSGPETQIDSDTRAAERGKLMARIQSLQHEADVLGKLVQAGGVAPDELRRKGLELDLARRDLDIANQEAERLRVAEARATLRSPVAGVVISMNVAQGQWVAMGEDVATLAGGSQREIVAFLDATDLQRVTEGQAVEFSEEPDNGRMRRGHVKSISRVAAGSQRQNAVKVIVAPDTDIADLRYSQQLYLEFIVRNEEGVLRVPKDVVHRANGQAVVYVLEGSRSVARSVVTAPGDRYFDKVVSGLSAQDRILRRAGAPQ